MSSSRLLPLPSAVGSRLLLCRAVTPASRCLGTAAASRPVGGSGVGLPRRRLASFGGHVLGRAHCAAAHASLPWGHDHPQEQRWQQHPGGVQRRALSSWFPENASVAHMGEVQEAGLGSFYTPVGLLQNAVEGM